MKIAFFGTGNFSRNILEDLLKYEDLEILFVVSQPDKLVGRKKELQITPVKDLALRHTIEVLQPISLRNDEKIIELSKDIDFFIVVAYGKIIPVSILEAPQNCSINLHGSLLPKYRGASPVQESLKSGDTITGLTTMYMSAGMDEGDMLLQKEIQIAPHDTQDEIFQKFETGGAQLLYETMKGIMNNTIDSRVQDQNGVSYCKKIEKNDGKIDFSIKDAGNIYNVYRAYSPWPGIFSYYNGKKFNIEECRFDDDTKIPQELQSGSVYRIDKKTIGIVCKNNSFLELKKVKLEGKKTMNILDFVNGNPEFLNHSF